MILGDVFIQKLNYCALHHKKILSWCAFKILNKKVVNDFFAFPQSVALFSIFPSIGPFKLILDILIYFRG
jgi:hypothetical protein